MTSILAVDTASAVIGVAWWNGQELRERTERVNKGSDTRVAARIEELAQATPGGLSALSGLAVAVGPGAFTGLRVGIASVAGLAVALDLKVVPMSSFEHRAATTDGSEVHVWLDARKGRVYTQTWASGQPTGPPLDVPPATALAALRRPFVVTGEGAMVHRAQIEDAGGSVLDRADDPCVGRLARLGAGVLTAGGGVGAEALRPVYVRSPDAVPTAQRS